MTEVALPASVGVVEGSPGLWSRASERLVAEDE